MLGHMVAMYLQENGHVITGFARKDLLLVKTIVGDVTDFSLLKELIIRDQFDAIVNCIGILNQVAEENKAQAVLLNSYLPHFLAKSTENMLTKIVHISTDCVFSGRKGNYEEKDLPDGITFYDRSKALGDLIDSKNITLRTSIIGPDLNENGIGLFNWFMHQSGVVKGFTKAIWSGQTTLQLAKTIEQSLQQNVHGLHHVVPETSISKCDLLRIFNRVFKNDSIQIVPSEEVSLDKSLKRTNYSLNYKIPDYETMLVDMKQWMLKHEKLYKHYM